MQTIKSDLWRKTSFCTCSYLKSTRGYRASFVSRAIQTWDVLLKLPFAEKVFLDDSSPNFNGMKLLKISDKLNDFDQVRYNTLMHPPHSNFGIVISMAICQSDYILHLDDDIEVGGTYDECLNFLEKCLNILEDNKNILGINLLQVRSGFPWSPGEDYSESDDFAHPIKYFGTAACLIKKQLLEKVSLENIMSWGTQQPANWEELVSDDASCFLVSKIPSPFTVQDETWVFNSTSTISILDKYTYLLRKKLGYL